MAKVENVESGMPAGKPKRRKKNFKKRSQDLKNIYQKGAANLRSRGVDSD